MKMGVSVAVVKLRLLTLPLKKPEEISSILKQNSLEHTCGHFNRWDVKTDNKLDNIIWKLNTKGFRYAALLVMSVLILVGCRTRRGRVRYTNGPVNDRFETKTEISKDSIK